MWLADPQPFMARFGLSSKQARFFQCTAEHLTAQCEGGNNTLANIAAACFHCNHTRHKAAKPLRPTEYQQRVQRRVRRGGWFPDGLAAKVGAGDQPRLL